MFTGTDEKPTDGASAAPVITDGASAAPLPTDGASAASSPAEEMIQITKQAGEQRFSAFEHLRLGQQAFFLFSEETFQSGENPVNELLAKNQATRQIVNVLQQHQKMGATDFTFPENTNDTTLRPGLITALAGDFYGPTHAHEVISAGPNLAERRRRFNIAYEKLASIASAQDEQELRELITCIDKETHAVEQAFIEYQSAAQGMKSKTVPTTSTYAYITRYHKWMIDSNLPMLSSRYIDLLRWNHDHFEEDALKAFEAGYEEALTHAEHAQIFITQDDEANAATELLLACTKMLFAGHYITDYCASGHTRTPRASLAKVLHKLSWRITPDISIDGVAGLLTHEMHDEDGTAGLHYHNGKNASWFGKGDSCLFDPDGLGAINLISTILALALADIELVFQNKPRSEAYKDYLPQITRGKNHLPLFFIEKDAQGNPVKAWCRKEPNFVKSMEQQLDTDNFEHDLPKYYTDNWNPHTTLGNLHHAKFFRQAERVKLTRAEHDAVFKKWQKLNDEEAKVVARYNACAMQ